MRTSQRLRKLKEWITRELCTGRQMKAPAPDNDITRIVMQEPRCYLAWLPARYDTSGRIQLDGGFNVCPGILIMPKSSHAKYVEEQRFDRYNHISRPQEMGQQLSVDMLFSVYEPGVRLPGFGEGGKVDMDLLSEGTEEGLFTLTNWMDDLMEKLLGQKFIPGTDLFVNQSTMVYSLYTDQNYVVDKRPIYYGFVTLDFYGYAEEGTNRNIDQYLI